MCWCKVLSNNSLSHGWDRGKRQQKFFAMHRWSLELDKRRREYERALGERIEQSGRRELGRQRARKLKFMTQIKVCSETGNSHGSEGACLPEPNFFFVLRLCWYLCMCWCERKLLAQSFLRAFRQVSPKKGSLPRPVLVLLGYRDSQWFHHSCSTPMLVWHKISLFAARAESGAARG